jgi:hypothetical protein
LENFMSIELNKRIKEQKKADENWKAAMDFLREHSKEKQ